MLSCVCFSLVSGTYDLEHSGSTTATTTTACNVLGAQQRVQQTTPESNAMITLLSE